VIKEVKGKSGDERGKSSDLKYKGGNRIDVKW
jgi:hypothetical protein